MATHSTVPRHARNVYIALVLLGIVAAMITGATLGFIVHEYVTRVELREPPPQEETAHAGLPTFTLASVCSPTHGFQRRPARRRSFAIMAKLGPCHV